MSKKLKKSLIIGGVIASVIVTSGTTGGIIQYIKNQIYHKDIITNTEKMKNFVHLNGSSLNKNPKDIKIEDLIMQNVDGASGAQDYKIISVKPKSKNELLIEYVKKTNLKSKKLFVIKITNQKSNYKTWENNIENFSIVPELINGDLAYDQITKESFAKHSKNAKDKKLDSIELTGVFMNAYGTKATLTYTLKSGVITKTEKVEVNSGFIDKEIVDAAKGFYASISSPLVLKEGITIKDFKTVWTSQKDILKNINQKIKNIIKLDVQITPRFTITVTDCLDKEILFLLSYNGKSLNEEGRIDLGFEGKATLLATPSFKEAKEKEARKIAVSKQEIDENKDEPKESKDFDVELKDEYLLYSKIKAKDFTISYFGEARDANEKKLNEFVDTIESIYELNKQDTIASDFKTIDKLNQELVAINKMEIKQKGFEIKILDEKVDKNTGVNKVTLEITIDKDSENKIISTKEIAITGYTDIKKLISDAISNNKKTFRIKNQYKKYINKIVTEDFEPITENKITHKISAVVVNDKELSLKVEVTYNNDTSSKYVGMYNVTVNSGFVLHTDFDVIKENTQFKEKFQENFKVKRSSVNTIDKVNTDDIESTGFTLKNIFGEFKIETVKVENNFNRTSKDSKFNVIYKITHNNAIETAKSSEFTVKMSPNFYVSEKGDAATNWTALSSIGSKRGYTADLVFYNGSTFNAWNNYWWTTKDKVEPNTVFSLSTKENNIMEIAGLEIEFFRTQNFTKANHSGLYEIVLILEDNTKKKINNSEKTYFSSAGTIDSFAFKSEKVQRIEICFNEQKLKEKKNVSINRIRILQKI